MVHCGFVTQCYGDFHDVVCCLGCFINVQLVFNICFLLFPSTHVLLGSLLGISAGIIINDSVERSKISLGFVKNGNIPCSVAVVNTSTCSGPVMVTTEGGLFHSLFPMQVVSDIPSDVVLEQDWVTPCHAAYIESCLKCSVAFAVGQFSSWP